MILPSPICTTDPGSTTVDSPGRRRAEAPPGRTTTVPFVDRRSVTTTASPDCSMRTCVEETSCSGDGTAIRRGSSPDSTRASDGLRPTRIGASRWMLSPGPTRTAKRNGAGCGTSGSRSDGRGDVPYPARPPGVSRGPAGCGCSVAVPGSSMSIAPGSSCATGTRWTTGSASGDSANSAGESCRENRLELRGRSRMIVSSALASPAGDPAAAASPACAGSTRSAVRSTRSIGALDQVNNSPSTTPRPIGSEPTASRATGAVGRSSPPSARPLTFRNSASTQG